MFALAMEWGKVENSLPKVGCFRGNGIAIVW
jgi:hypothetical protein